MIIAIWEAQQLLQYEKPNNYDAISRFQPACGAALAAVYSGQVKPTNVSLVLLVTTIVQSWTFWIPMQTILTFKMMFIGAADGEGGLSRWGAHFIEIHWYSLMLVDID